MGLSKEKRITVSCVCLCQCVCVFTCRPVPLRPRRPRKTFARAAARFLFGSVKVQIKINIRQGRERQYGVCQIYGIVCVCVCLSMLPFLTVGKNQGRLYFFPMMKEADVSSLQSFDTILQQLRVLIFPFLEQFCDSGGLDYHCPQLRFLNSWAH